MGERVAGGALAGPGRGDFCIVSNSIPDVRMRHPNTDYHPVADVEGERSWNTPALEGEMSESERTDLDVDDELDAGQVWRAQRVVAAQSLDAEDCRMLLSMLGIAGNPDSPGPD